MMEFTFWLWFSLLTSPKFYIIYFFPIFSPLLVGIGFALYRHRVKHAVGGAVISAIVASIIALELATLGFGG